MSALFCIIPGQYKLTLLSVFQFFFSSGSSVVRYSTCVHIHQTCRDTDATSQEQTERENVSKQLQHDVYDHHRFFLPPLTEPAGGLQPAAESPEPGSRAADTASETVNPTDTHTATVEGSAAHSPPMCQEVSETLTAPDTQFKFKSAHGICACLYSDRLTVCHDGSCESRAVGETVLPVVTSGIVVTHKHTPLQ